MKRILMVIAIAAMATAAVADSHPASLEHLADRAFQMLAMRVAGLTAKQKLQIDDLLHTSVRQGKLLQNDPQLTGPARKQQLDALIQTTADRIRALLNPDQRIQFDLAVRSMTRE